GNFRRVVSDFDRLSIIGFFRGHELVSRIWLGSAAITHYCFNDPRRFVEGWLNAPETATRENCGLRLIPRRILSQREGENGKHYGGQDRQRHARSGLMNRRPWRAKAMRCANRRGRAAAVRPRTGGGGSRDA